MDTKLETWTCFAIASFLFVVVGIILVICGIHSTYHVTDNGGDAYNFVIAANRGTALIAAGACSMILGASSAIIAAIFKK